MCLAKDIPTSLKLANISVKIVLSIARHLEREFVLQEAKNPIPCCEAAVADLVWVHCNCNKGTCLPFVRIIPPPSVTGEVYCFPRRQLFFSFDRPVIYHLKGL